MSYETIKTERNNGLLEITINRPDKLNALNETVLKELKVVLEEVKSDGFETKGILITGEGDKAFIAGADIKAMSEMTPDQAEGFGSLGQGVSRLFETVPVPVIACVNGFALGGGCEMAMSCDFIYATKNALFGQPEVNLALIPGFGGTQRLRRFVGIARSRELIYTGRNVKIDEAEKIGLVSRVFESKDEMLSAARETLGIVASKSPLIIAKCKEVINQGECCGIESGLEIEKSGFKSVFSTADTKEGLSAFLEKRKPEFTGK
ncbi:MAG: enoyl-CoA hydratase/isomerase family protein [Bacteriovoracaceae bacterium]|nr:enoyl-CoA hydratase/isomerase family protein [Bacteriovoracaceae bacterium]